MQQYIETDEIKSILAKGLAHVLVAEHCGSFNDYLCKEYPWIQFSDRIDWEEVKKPYKRFRWKEATVEETTEFLKTTCLNNFNEVGIIYAASQPGLIVNLDYVCKNLENLVIFGWATRFLVGIKRNKYGIIELNKNCFLEIDFVNWLTASC